MDDDVRLTLRLDPELGGRLADLALHLGTSRSEVTRIGLQLAHSVATQLDLESDQAAHELGERLPSMREKVAAREGEIRNALRPATSTLWQSMN